MSNKLQYTVTLKMWGRVEIELVDVVDWVYAGDYVIFHRDGPGYDYAIMKVVGLSLIEEWTSELQGGA